MKSASQRIIPLLMLILSAYLAGCSTIASNTYEVVVDERSTEQIAIDKNIFLQIRSAFLNEKNFSSSGISVYCFNNQVFLVGTRESQDQEKRAVKLASGVKDVKSVQTYLLNSKDFDISNTYKNVEIATKIRSNMVFDSSLKSTQFEIESIYGHVVLLGVVASGEDKHKAVKYARETEGVISVKDFLLVK